MTFRFFNFWASHPDFDRIVVGIWNTPMDGSRLFQVCKKLKCLKEKLKAFNGAHFRNLPNQSSLARQSLLNIQRQLRFSPNDDTLRSLEREALSVYTNACKAEESFHAQKFRIKWLKEGDSNTSFFHNSVKSRFNRNKLVSLALEDGSTISDPVLIKEEATTFFHSILNGSAAQPYPGKSFLSHYISKQISRAHCESLIEDITSEEVKKALFSIHPNKAPGPDGFNAFFFQRVWHIIGDDLTVAIQAFFISGHLLKEVNHASISLVPKVLNPATLNDYRPISCCKTIYKCISKIMANRLKQVLPNLIDEAQSAFIQGRSISDNIFMAQELLRNYHRKDTTSRCAIKVDIRRAFDTVQWDFLLDLLELLGFPPLFIHWIRACITTPKFSVNINGELAGFFSSSRGIRQGDPLSPYLFVIAMDALAMILQKNISVADTFSYHWRCEATSTTHICFADDLILFCGGSLHAANIIKHSLDTFFSCYGMEANSSKSVVLVAGDNASFREKVIALFGYSLGSLPIKHLY